MRNFNVKEEPFCVSGGPPGHERFLFAVLR